ncbi:MAG: serine hydrolase, partial [Saprospiraceae bacterium]|nr:serine hydrolase [Saprospiraceae bacterium]
SLLLVLLIPPPTRSQTHYFQAQTLDGDVQIGYGLAIGDVDGDANPDILLADKKEFVWFRNGDWKRFAMAKDLTDRDNVCIAARDINGDGKIEVAVGAQWNPGETVDENQSGSVHYLIRPEDPTQLWEPVPLHHEPTVHRMRWVRTNGGYRLVVVPLHGRGNENGEGEGVKVLSYQMPSDPYQTWATEVIDDELHITHNLDVVPDGDGEAVLLGGKEGAKLIRFENGSWIKVPMSERIISDAGFGEIRWSKEFIAGIQPLHGNTLVTYDTEGADRTVLLDSLQQGHALAIDDLLNLPGNQIVAGWRDLNDNGEMGIRLYFQDGAESDWQWMWIDRNSMACEDLKVADLNGDGWKDIIASGRSTHNLKIYWNWSGRIRESQEWDRQIQDLMQRAEIPGLSVAILENGLVRYVKSFGVKNTETAEPVVGSTQFEAASLTKPVIAYAVVKLAQEGKLDLDRPLFQYYRYEGIEDSEAAKQITARMVLTHTTGLPNWRSPRNAQQVKLQNAPGSWFSYSGEGFVYLATVCEEITGLPTHEWIDQTVFQPLGMLHSSMIWEDHFERTAALPHNKDGQPSEKWKAKEANAAASLSTTAADYARFMVALFHGEDLIPEWKEQMLSIQQRVDPNCSQCREENKNPEFAEVSWGLGIGLEAGNETYLWHWGDNGDFKSYMCMSRDSGDGLVYFANSTRGLSIRDNLVRLLLPEPHPAHQWVSYDQID